MPTIVERLGDYAERLRFDNIDHNAIEYAKRILLDSLGCGFGGLQGEPTRIVLETVKQLGAADQSTIIGGGIKASAPLAALVNGVSIRYLDFNDVYFGPAWTAHPSDNIGALLATAELCNSPGRDVLVSMITAYEIQIRFSDLPVKRNLWHEGWHHTAACAYASAAGVGKLMGLDSSQIAHSIALSGVRGNTFSEIRHGDIPMDKALSAPMVASNSILYASLARRGFTGCMTLLEGPYGFRFAVARGVDLECLIPTLEDFRIFKISMKPYPVEGMTIAMVQAALELRDQYEIDPGEIERINIFVHEEGLSKPSWDARKLVPTSKETADHSYHYCVAVALIAGEVTPRQFTEVWLGNKNVAKLMARTNIEAKAEYTELFKKGARPAAVEIATQRGIFYREVKYPHGDPFNPMTDDEVGVKFVSAAEPYLGRERAQEVVERTLAIEKEVDMRSFMKNLGGEP